VPCDVVLRLRSHGPASTTVPAAPLAETVAGRVTGIDLLAGSEQLSAMDFEVLEARELAGLT
jgi:hypothetical protein